MPTLCPNGHPVPARFFGFCPRCFNAHEPGPAGLPTVPRHRLLEEIGNGGTGRVFLARENQTGHLRAVKVIRSRVADDPVAIDRFRKEFSAVQAIRSDHVVRVHEFDAATDTAWFSMDVVEGGTLKDWLGARDRRDRNSAVRVLLGVASGLQAAHRNLVHHLDLKPSNVLIDARGCPILIDFGASEMASTGAPLFGPAERWFTPQYAAPELRENRLGRGFVRADIYSFGLVMCEVLTGIVPVAGTRASNDLPRDLRAVCAKCLDLEPDRRFASMDEVHSELTRYAGGYPAQCRRVWWPVHAGYALRRNKVTGGALIGLALLAVTASGFGAAVYADQLERRAADRARERAAVVARMADDADAAARRGDWSSALSGYRDAIAGNHPDRPRLEVARLRSLFASNRLDGLATQVEELLAAPDMAARRADLLLLRGERELIDAERPDRGLTDVRAALDTQPPLGPADEAYALGLIATTTTDTLAHFRQAVTRDATHRPARSALVMGLLLSGRRSEARTELETLRSLCPADPLVPLADGLLALYSGDEAAGLAAFARLAADLPPEQGDRLQRHARTFATLLRSLRAFNTAPVFGPPPPAARAAVANAPDSVLSLLKEGARTQGPLGLPQPVIARFFDWTQVYLKGGQMLLRGGPMSDVIAVVDPALERTPDAALLQLSAGAHMLKAQEYLRPDQKEKLIAELRTVIERGEAAAVAPTAIPFGTFPYQGRTIAAFALALLALPGFDQGDDTRLREHLRELVREGEKFPELRAESIELLLRNEGLSAEQSRVLLADWGLSTAGKSAPWERLANLESRLGNPGAAKAAATRALAAAPADTALKSRLDRILRSPAGK